MGSSRRCAGVLHVGFASRYDTLRQPDGTHQPARQSAENRPVWMIAKLANGACDTHGAQVKSMTFASARKKTPEPGMA